MRKLLLLITLCFTVFLLVACAPSEELPVNNGEEPAEEPVIEEPLEADDQEPAVEEEPVVLEDPGEVEEVMDESDSLVVSILEDGFEPDELTVKVGDTVTFSMDRGDTRLDEAEVHGVRNCNDIESPRLYGGDTFEVTFEEAGTCTLVEVISINQVMEIRVEE